MAIKSAGVWLVAGVLAFGAAEGCKKADEGTPKPPPGDGAATQPADKPADGAKPSTDAAKPAAPQAPAAAKIEKAMLEGVTNVTRLGDIYFAGAVDEPGVAAMKAAGIKRVINLRTDGELKYDEKTKVTEAGMKYVQHGVGGATPLGDAQLDGVRKELKEAKGEPVMLHCASGNRVGAVWLAYRVLDDGVPFEKALEEAKAIGLKSADLEKTASDYIAKHQKK